MRTEAASIVEGRRPRLAGDILWLGITASVSVVIVGIMCWSLAAGLSPSAASGRPVAAVVTPETTAGSAVNAASPTLATNSIPTPGLPSTIADASTGGVQTTPAATGIEQAGVKSSLNPLAVQSPNQHPSGMGASAPATSSSQPASSATAEPVPRWLGSHHPASRRPRAPTAAHSATAEPAPR